MRDEQLRHFRRRLEQERQAINLRIRTEQAGGTYERDPHGTAMTARPSDASSYGLRPSISQAATVARYLRILLGANARLLVARCEFSRNRDYGFRWWPGCQFRRPCCLRFARQSNLEQHKL